MEDLAKQNFLDFLDAASFVSPSHTDACKEAVVCGKCGRWNELTGAEAKEIVERLYDYFNDPVYFTKEQMQVINDSWKDLK